VDRLIALVTNRWRMDLRRLLGTRERALGLVLYVPGILIFSGLGSLVVFGALRGLERAAPELVLPVVSAAATGIGLFWAASPLLAGVALSEAADVSRLMHFPIPLPVLALSSLVANLAQPAGLAQLPLLASAAAGLSGGRAVPFLAALLGVSSTFVLILAAAQVAGLLLHGLSRHRRLHDLLLFVGLGAGLLLSLAPLLLLTGGPGSMAALLRAFSGADFFAASPYAWGVRAAIHAGRGEVIPGLAYGVLAVAAILGTMAAAAALVQSIERGPLAPGGGGALRSKRSSSLGLPGAIGALVEKDLRLAWRDPGLRAVLVMGLAGPLLVVFFLSRGGPSSGSGTPALLLASFVGLSTFGANALGMERRGISLLLAFPVERWRILAGKNVAALVFRLPSLVTLAIAALILAPLAYAPAAATIAVATLLLSAGVDNYNSILFPIPVPGAAANPYGRAASRGRGLGAVLVSLMLLFSSLVLSAPFAFLAWVPALLGRPWLWTLTLPLALAGSASVYAMLVAGAGNLMAKREPELLERILVEA
jgi:ABC-2 type transport system permease protein